MPDGRALDISIPEGTADGQTLRLRGQGMAGSGKAPAGDAYVEIAVRPHPMFQREGDDILIQLPISIDEAVLGGKLTVPTIGGRVAMMVPSGSTSGQILRLRGKGVHYPTRGTRGDQLVELRIAMPARIDPELSEFMTRWRQTHAYDPRANMQEQEAS